MNSYQQFFRRRFSSNVKEGISSSVVRSRFIDFFSENNHNFIRSSSVVPRNDPTIPFINAGMCQFKHFLSGEMEPPFKRVVNSQKCIRVSGKHNDLNEVGLDGHHHTFFEMLGNWSFNDYSKETACKLAWELLTTPPFSLDTKRLYVTYFGGDTSQSVPPDIETREIWKKIGVQQDHIIAAGMTDNFWEMSRIGPCGPCTEILIDRNHKEGKIPNLSELTELWNIVFIQYNREEDRSLKLLEHSHVDTGMGLERVLAVLLNKSSNYDTDLFIPLFETIHKVAGVRKYGGKFGKDDADGLDTIYRKLADHCRMATVSLADGVFPDINPKLKRILRKALTMPTKYFGFDCGENLVVELSKRVAESLVVAYPEIQTNFQQVVTLINHEAEHLKSLQKSSNAEWNRLLALHPELSAVDVQSMLGITTAYKDTQKQMVKRNVKRGDFLPSDLVVRLFDTFGLDLEAAHDLGSVLGFKIDFNDFNEEFGGFKNSSKENTATILKQSKLLSNESLQTLQRLYPKTDDSFKYDYRRVEDNCYAFNKLSSNLLAVINNDDIIFSANSLNEEGNGNVALQQVTLRDGEELSFIFDRTCFYYEAGGQESDVGYILLENSDSHRAKISVVTVKNFNGFVIHRGRVQLESSTSQFPLRSSCSATLIIDENRRLGNMRNHTAVHILHTILGQSQGIVAQRASAVCSDALRLDFNLYGSKLTVADMVSIEDQFKKVILSSIPVEREVVGGDKIFLEDIKLLPGEVYPFETISTIKIKDGEFFSKEACCGTHVLNTKDIEAFVITKCKTQSRMNSISAVTGESAVTASANADRVNLKIENFKASTKNLNTGSQREYQDFLKYLEFELKNSVMPVNSYNAIQEFKEIGLNKKLKELCRASVVDELVANIENFSVKTSDKFTVHFLSTPQPLNQRNLLAIIERSFTRDQPAFICGFTGDSVLAICRVPVACVSENFNAKKWMDAAVETFIKQSAKQDNEKIPSSLKKISDEVILFEKSVKYSKQKKSENAKLIAESAVAKAEEMFS